MFRHSPLVVHNACLCKLYFITLTSDLLLHNLAKFSIVGANLPSKPLSAYWAIYEAVIGWDVARVIFDSNKHTYSPGFKMKSELLARIYRLIFLPINRCNFLLCLWKMAGKCDQSAGFYFEPCSQTCIKQSPLGNGQLTT